MLAALIQRKLRQYSIPPVSYTHLTDLDVLQMNFEDMEFENVFDGIWACGSLIHIPKNEMPEILGRIHDALCSDEMCIRDRY